MATLGASNHQIHSLVTEVLQIVTSRGEAEILGLESIESAITTRLYLCIHRKDLDLQNKLLHILHSVVHSLSSAPRKQRRGVQAVENVDFSSEVSPGTMFVRVLKDALSVQHNNAALHHWIDFLLMTIPLYRHSLSTVVLPLIDCIVARIHALVADFKLTYSRQQLEAKSETDEAEFVVLANALERLVLIAIAETAPSSAEVETRLNDRQTSDSINSSNGGRLIGYMSGVLGNSDADLPKVAPARVSPVSS